MRDSAPLPDARKGDLTAGPVNRLLIRLTVPMIWGLLAMISFQLADLYFLSRLGDLPLAAIGFTIPVTMVILSLIIAMGISTSSVASRLVGGGAREDARRFATHALLLAGLTGLTMAVLSYALIGPVFRAMGADMQTLPPIRDFMSVYALGIPFLSILMVGNAVLRAFGDTRAPAFVLVACAVINIVLDPIMIFGLFGFPRMEIEGAALANVMSEVIACGVGLYFMHIRNELFERMDLRDFGASTKRFLVIALPVGLANILQPLTGGVITALLARTANDAVAAYGIASRVEALAFVVIMALAIGMGPVIGQNWGAKSYDRVFQALKSAFAFVIAWSLAVALVLAVFGRTIAGWFSADAEVLDTATLYFRIVPMTYAAGNLVNGWGSAFNAMGMPKNSFMLIVIRLLALTLPLAWIGSMIAAAPGLFIGLAIANLLCGAGSMIVCWRICRAAAANSAVYPKPGRGPGA